MCNRASDRSNSSKLDHHQSTRDGRYAGLPDSVCAPAPLSGSSCPNALAALRRCGGHCVPIRFEPAGRDPERWREAVREARPDLTSRVPDGRNPTGRTGGNAVESGRPKIRRGGRPRTVVRLWRLVRRLHPPAPHTRERNARRGKSTTRACLGGGARHAPCGAAAPCGSSAGFTTAKVACSQVHRVVRRACPRLRGWMALDIDSFVPPQLPCRAAHHATMFQGEVRPRSG